MKKRTRNRSDENKDAYAWWQIGKLKREGDLLNLLLYKLVSIRSFFHNETFSQSSWKITESDQRLSNIARFSEKADENNDMWLRFSPMYYIQFVQFECTRQPRSQGFSLFFLPPLREKHWERGWYIQTVMIYGHFFKACSTGHVF